MATTGTHLRRKGTRLIFRDRSRCYGNNCRSQLPGGEVGAQWGFFPTRPGAIPAPLRLGSTGGCRPLPGSEGELSVLFNAPDAPLEASHVEKGVRAHTSRPNRRLFRIPGGALKRQPPRRVSRRSGRFVAPPGGCGREREGRGGGFPPLRDPPLSLPTLGVCGYQRLPGSWGHLLSIGSSVPITASGAQGEEPLAK